MTDASICTAHSARGESGSRYAIGDVAGCFEFGALLSKVRRGINWVVDGIGRIGREDMSNVGHWRFIALVLKVRVEGNWAYWA